MPTQTWRSLSPLPDPGGPTYAPVLTDGTVVMIVPGTTGVDGGITVERLHDGGWSIGPDVPSGPPWDTIQAAAPGPDALVRLLDTQLTAVAWEIGDDAAKLANGAALATAR